MPGGSWWGSRPPKAGGEAGALAGNPVWGCRREGAAWQEDPVGRGGHDGDPLGKPAFPHVLSYPVLLGKTESRATKARGL